MGTDGRTATMAKAWAILCKACGYNWKLAGNWSDFERQAAESRPCPCCGSYTLTSPEPKPVRRRGLSVGRRAG